MGPEWLNAMLVWIEANPALAGLAIAAIAFVEGIALLGVVIPGIILLFGVGALVGVGIIDLGTAWAWAAGGAFAGDGISYWIGRRYRSSIRDTWPFNRHEETLDRGQAIFLRHGLKSVIIGRFVGPIRPIMPLVAGMMTMAPKRYFPASLFACVLWAPAYLLPGVVFGASMEIAQAVALRLAVAVGLVIGLVTSLWWLVYRCYRYLAPRASQLLDAALAWSLAHPRLGAVARNLVDPRKPESGTLAVFGLFLVLAAAAALTLLIAIPVTGGPLLADQAVLEFMQRLRAPSTDRFMAVLSGLGGYAVLTPAVLAVLVWLIWRRRGFAAAHWIAAVGLGLVLSVVISRFVTIARDAALPAAPGGAYALIHIGLSVVVYGFFAILIARELPRRRRVWPYAVASLFVALIALARLYFGAHWLSDVVVGIFVGVAWITVLGIAYRTRIRRSFWTAPLAAVFFLTVGGAAFLHATTGADRIIDAYTPIEQAEEVPVRRWQAGNWAPEIDVDMPVPLQFAGSLEGLQAALASAGWEPPEDADWQFVFEMLQPEPTATTLPLLPAVWNGKRQALALQRLDDPDGQHQLVLRLWPTSARVDGAPIWVGNVLTYRIDQTAWIVSYWRRADDGAGSFEAIAPALRAAGLEVIAAGEGLRVSSDPGRAGSE
ncbi:MAG: VTT domain-containing protein [Pseudomonadota bacterium]